MKARASRTCSTTGGPNPTCNATVGSLQLYHQEHPDVILLDLNMPELDGVTVLKQIRAADVNQPVIVMTADSSPETEQQVRAIGVNEFVLKTSSMHLLENTLAHLFMSRKPKFG